MIHFYCAGCREKIEGAQVPGTVVVHPSPRLWSLTHTLHPMPHCIRRYVLNHPRHFPVPNQAGPTVAELEQVAGVRVIANGDSRGYARLVEREAA